MTKRLPVVLINGFWPINLAFPGISGAWRDGGLPAVLKNRGHEVIEAGLPWSASGWNRAQALALILADAGGLKKGYHLVGHSVGGLDARTFALRHFDDPVLGPIVSISTLATPHWGTAFADWLQDQKLDGPMSRVGQIYGINIRALDELMFQEAIDRNKERLDQERKIYEKIPFYAYAGKQEAADLFWVLRFSWGVIKRAPRAINIRVFPKAHDGSLGKADVRQEARHAKTVQAPYWAGGLNDGLVSVDSAHWVGNNFVGRDETIWNFDHLNFTGHWDPAEVELFSREGYDSRFLDHFRDEYQCFAERVVETIEEAEA